MTLSSAARHVAAAAVACAFLIVLVSPVAAQTFPGRLAVRIYDYSSTATKVRLGAVDEARSILADAGVNADWHDCDNQESTCAPEPGELIVRIVREVGAHGTDWRQALGFSVIDSTAGAGTLATVFINRVEFSSRRAGADLATVLGRAIAHEVGHLILRTNAHADEGLMRAIWTEQELSRNTHDDWVFASSDRRQIRAAMQRITRAASR